MRIVLVGFLCMLLAVGLTYTVGILGLVILLREFYPSALQDTSVGFIVALDTMLVMAPSLVLGLCIVAPLIPKVRASGLQSAVGVTLILGIVAVQVGVPVLVLINTRSRPEDVVIVALTVLLGLAGTALALFFFDRFTVRERLPSSKRPPLSSHQIDAEKP